MPRWSNPVVILTVLGAFLPCVAEPLLSTASARDLGPVTSGILRPGALIFQTRSGELLQYELPTLRRTAIGAVPSETRDLAAREDGSIYYGRFAENGFGRFVADLGVNEMFPTWERRLFSLYSTPGFPALFDRFSVAYGLAVTVFGGGSLPRQILFRQRLPDGLPEVVSMLDDPTTGPIGADYFGDLHATVGRRGEVVYLQRNLVIAVDVNTGSRSLVHDLSYWGFPQVIATEASGNYVTATRDSVVRVPARPTAMDPVRLPVLFRLRDFASSVCDPWIHDLKLDAHGRFVVVGGTDCDAARSVYHYDPLRRTGYRVFTIPESDQLWETAKLTIVPPRRFQNCDPNSQVAGDLCNIGLSLSAVPDSVTPVQFSISGSFTLRADAALFSPLEQPLTVQIGDVALTLPEKSLLQTTSGGYVFDGKAQYVTREASIASVPLKLSLTQIGREQFAFSISGTAALEKSDGVMDVKLTIGENRGAAMVTLASQAMPMK